MCVEIKKATAAGGGSHLSANNDHTCHKGSSEQGEATSGESILFNDEQTGTLGRDARNDVMREVWVKIYERIDGGGGGRSQEREMI